MKINITLTRCEIISLSFRMLLYGERGLYYLCIKFEVPTHDDVNKDNDNDKRKFMTVLDGFVEFVKNSRIEILSLGDSMLDVSGKLNLGGAPQKEFFKARCSGKMVSQSKKANKQEDISVECQPPTCRQSRICSEQV